MLMLMQSKVTSLSSLATAMASPPHQFYFYPLSIPQIFQDFPWARCPSFWVTFMPRYLVFVFLCQRPVGICIPKQEKEIMAERRKSWWMHCGAAGRPCEAQNGGDLEVIIWRLKIATTPSSSTKVFSPRLDFYSREKV